MAPLRGIPAAAILAAAAALLPAAPGCATASEEIAPARAAWEAGDPAGALAALDALRPRIGKDAHLLDLERSSALQALGRFGAAADAAVDAAEAMDDREAADLASWVGAVLADDTAFPFEGADHEKVLARAMASVSLLMAGAPDDARALALQVNRVQDRLRSRAVLEREDDARPGYHPFALGEYLRALSDEQRGFLDEAAIGYAEAARYGFPGAGRERDRVKRNRLAEGEGRGAVVVLFLAGNGPLLVERVEPVTSAAFMAASSILNARKGFGMPSQAPVELPWPEPRPSPVAALRITSGAGLLGTTETLLDVDETALRQAADEMPRALVRAICRRAFKEYTKNLAKDAVAGKEHNWLGFLVDVAGYVWTGAERADTRCWSFLPKRIQVARIEVPEGDSILHLAPVDARGLPAGEEAALPVRVSRSRIGVVLVVAPVAGPPPFAFADPRTAMTTVLNPAQISREEGP
ncbi:MAG: hypothetical protein L6R43_02495 [Planctomycetes bacterium]|nr:hypothetical protein [Planctomycetota bacterium]